MVSSRALTETARNRSLAPHFGYAMMVMLVMMVMMVMMAADHRRRQIRFVLNAVVAVLRLRH